MGLPEPTALKTSTKTPATLKYHLALLLTTTIWASTFINIKVVLSQIPPNTLALLRFLVASMVLGIYLCFERQPAIRKKDWPQLALGGLTGITLYNFLQNQGLKYAGATEAAILAAMAPVFIAVFALVSLRETLSLRQALGIGVAFAGSALVATQGSLSGPILDSARLFGDFLVLLTGLSWAVYSAGLKKLLNVYPPATVLAYSTFAGTLFLLPLALWEQPVKLQDLDLSTWLHILYLGVMASVLAYLMWNIALARVRAVAAGAYLYLIPVIAAAIAAVFLKEMPTLYTFIGGLMVLAGTYFVST